MQHRTAVILYGARLRRLRGCGRPFRYQLPVAERRPAVLRLASFAHREEAYWLAAALCLVHIARLERHGPRIGKINGGVPEAAVHQDGDGNQVWLALPIRRQFHHRQGTRAFFFFLLLSFGRGLIRPPTPGLRDRWAGAQRCNRQQRHGGESPAFAVKLMAYEHQRKSP